MITNKPYISGYRHTILRPNKTSSDSVYDGVRTSVIGVKAVFLTSAFTLTISTITNLHFYLFGHSKIVHFTLIHDYRLLALFQ